MARTRVELDHAGMRQLLKSAEVQDDLLHRAERVADVARAIAPVRSGRYKASIEAVDDPAASRARARVRATVPYAHLVEAHVRVLGRALDAAGD